MRDVSRHKSMDVPQGYVRDGDMFRGWDCFDSGSSSNAGQSLVVKEGKSENRALR